jgi:peptidyl-prolyl cis-trans isomerase C
MSPAAAQEDPPEDSVVARINGAEIMLSDVVAFHDTLPDQYRALPLEALYPALIERMIDFSLIAALGRKEGLEDDAEVKRRAARAENEIIRDVYIERVIGEGVSDAALTERYEAFLRDAPRDEEVRASHILVEEETTAREIIARLEDGAEFAEVAAESSIGPSGPSGGDIGYFTREAVVPEFAEAAFSLEPGMMTKDPVQTEFGWHVIRVEDRRIMPPPSFEEMREQFVGEMSQELVNGLIERLREGAEIERFNPDGSPGEALPEQSAE